jgi:type VI secretion system Hcp family effector
MTVLVTPRRIAVALALAAVVTFLFLQRAGGLPSADATGGVPIWGTCTGQKSGVIKSESTAKGHQGQWPITAMSHEVVVPTDATSGLPAGRPMHKPLTFTMSLGMATPLLLNSLVTNETLTTCTFKFYKPRGDQAPVAYFQIKLTNATVDSYKLSGHQSSADTVTFTLSYQKIQWVSAGGTAAQDDWSVPRA